MPDQFRSGIVLKNMMILAIIYCIPVFILTCAFLKDVVNGWFKDFNKLEIILLYIFGCLLWPIGLIIGLTEYLLENMALKRKTEKESKREMVCKVLEELKIG